MNNVKKRVVGAIASLARVRGGVPILLGIFMTGACDGGVPSLSSSEDEDVDVDRANALVITIERLADGRHTPRSISGNTRDPDAPIVGRLVDAEGNLLEERAMSPEEAREMRESRPEPEGEVRGAPSLVYLSFSRMRAKDPEGYERGLKKMPPGLADDLRKFMEEGDKVHMRDGDETK